MFEIFIFLRILFYNSLISRYRSYGEVNRLVILQFFLFIAVAVLGGIIGTHLKLPVGTMIGAMFAVGISRHFELISFHTSTPLTFFYGTAIIGDDVWIIFY
jgi:uncharacterized membrane protein AbrB (regulator of aidB expression)